MGPATASHPVPGGPRVSEGQSSSGCLQEPAWKHSSSTRWCRCLVYAGPPWLSRQPWVCGLRAPSSARAGFIQELTAGVSPGKGGCDCAGPLLPSSQELGRSCDLAGGNLSQEELSGYKTARGEGRRSLQLCLENPLEDGTPCLWQAKDTRAGNAGPLERVVALPDREVTSE